MKIGFRTDASLQIGHGHVMRCLTLADALRAQGAQCYFISRAHPGHLMDVILQRGYIVKSLATPVLEVSASVDNATTYAQNEQECNLLPSAHFDWLGCTWQIDAQETYLALASQELDWLVVDHYALDQRWEKALAQHYLRLFVIDDLADRPHCCNLLLDQNLGRKVLDYKGLLPNDCKLLIGPSNSLLRPEFGSMRIHSLQRRQAKPGLQRIIIAMGGVDQINATGIVLRTLKSCPLPPTCRVTVVMGKASPWVQNVRELAAFMPCPTEVLVNVNNMSQLMAESDLAIGAAGSMTWERCSLGLPTLIVVLAENQRLIANTLDKISAGRLIGTASDISVQLPLAVLELSDLDRRTKMSLAAASITDGSGTEKIIKAMSKFSV